MKQTRHYLQITVVLDRERFLQAIESIEIFDGFGYEDRDRADVLALGRHIDKFQRMQTSFEEMRKEHSKAASSVAKSKSVGAKSAKKSAQQEALIGQEKIHTKASRSVKARASIILDTDDDSSEDEDSEEDPEDFEERKERKENSTTDSNESIDGGVKLQDGLLHLMSAFSPECDDNDTTERIVKTMYRLCRVERIGMFLCDWKRDQLILSIAREGGARGIRIPMKGIAGHVAKSGRVVNVLDASKEPRFDQTMDKKTGFKTKTILAVPIRSHDIIEDRTGSNKGKNRVLGVIQLINKTSGRGKWSLFYR